MDPLVAFISNCLVSPFKETIAPFEILIVVFSELIFDSQIDPELILEVIVLEVIFPFNWAPDDKSISKWSVFRDLKTICAPEVSLILNTFDLKLSSNEIFEPEVIEIFSKAIP